MGDIFGNYVFGLRRVLRWTIRQAEECTGISDTYISQIESGKRPVPSTAILKRFATGYGVPMEQVLKAAARDRYELAGEPAISDEIPFLAEEYRKLNQENQQKLLDYLDWLAECQRREGR